MEAQELIEALRSLVAPTWREIYSKISDKKDKFRAKEKTFNRGYLRLTAIYNDEQQIGRVRIDVINYKAFPDHTEKLIERTFTDIPYTEVIDHACEEWIEARLIWDTFKENDPDISQYDV